MSRRNSGPRLRWLDKRQCYYIVWTEGGRSRERSTGTRDRSTAERQLAGFISSRYQDDDDDPKKPKEILITDILADYLSESVIDNSTSVSVKGFQKRQRKTKKRREIDVMKHLIDCFEGKRLSFINNFGTNIYREFRTKSDGTSLSDATIRRELSVLRAAINHAKARNRITHAPALELPKDSPSKMRWLTRSEAAKLLWEARRGRAKGYLVLFIHIALRTGKRKGAILSLTRNRIDLVNEVIDWDEPGVAHKTKARGKNPIPERLLPHLRSWLNKNPKSQYIISQDGFPINEISKGFSEACKRAGLKDVTIHTLRHTCATWLMQQGIDKWQICGFLGMSIQILENVYGHHHPDHQEGAKKQR